MGIRLMVEVMDHDLAGYLATLAPRGDLADWQGHGREQNVRRQARVAADDRRTRPCCPHGEAGPVSTWPASADTSAHGAVAGAFAVITRGCGICSAEKIGRQRTIHR